VKLFFLLQKFTGVIGFHHRLYYKTVFVNSAMKTFNQYFYSVTQESKMNEILQNLQQQFVKHCHTKNFNNNQYFSKAPHNIESRN